MYTVVGYEKDNDVYIKYGEYTVEVFAVWKARELVEQVERGELRREDNGEPIDWIEIYENYGESDEKRLHVYFKGEN